MEDPKNDHKLHANLVGFYHFLAERYRYPEERLNGIIACTGMILHRIRGLTISLADLDHIRAYFKTIGLTGDAINIYLRSFVLYVTYMEHRKA